LYENPLFPLCPPVVCRRLAFTLPDPCPVWRRRPGRLRGWRPRRGRRQPGPGDRGEF